MTDRKTRLELDALSKEIFGVSSKWQKLVEKGYREQVTEEVTETVPSEKEGEPPTTKQVQVPVKTEFGAFQFVVKRHTVESVRTFMVQQKAMMEQVRAMIAKQNEEAEAKKLADAATQKALEVGTGSAV